MVKTVTRPWDPAEHLKTQEEMVAYLDVPWRMEMPGS
jgi:hypothetical protein